MASLLQRRCRSAAARMAGALAVLTALTVAAPAAWATPSVTITAPTNDQTVTSPSLTVEGSFSGITQGDTVTGTVSVNGGASQALTITGSDFNAAVTLAAGSNTIDVTVTDNNQQTGSTSGSATAAVTLQTVPVVTLGTPTVSGTTIDFTGTVSDTTVTQATVIFDGTALKTIPVSAGSFSSFVDTSAGNHTLSVSATNGAGTGTSVSQSVAVLSTGTSVSNTVSGTATSSSTPITVGGPGTSVPDTTATASGGTGTLTVESYSGNPGPAVTFSASGAYLDVSVSSTSTFTSVVVVQCSVAGGDSLYWLDGTTWTAVSAAAVYSSGCLTFTAGSTSSPTVAQLTGTPFAVAASTVVAAAAGGGAPIAAAPVVSQVSPGTGPAAGGTAVTISGSGLSGATAVDFGANAATGVTVVSDTEITAVSPAGTGTVDVRVTTPSGTSATGLGDQFSYASSATAPAPAPAPASATHFSDVPSGYWAASYIATLAGKGIIAGFPDGTFRPDAAVTRAEFVKMLDLTLGLAPGTGASAFADVPASAWYTPYVLAAFNSGIVEGTSRTTFSPDATLTREQMAVLLARALKLSGTASLTFTDHAQIDPWAVSAVQAAVAAGYLSGFPDGSFQPLQTTTRAQAAKVLATALAHGSVALLAANAAGTGTPAS